MPEMEYYMVRTGEDQGGAIYPAEESGMKVYFDTDDIDASIAKVRDLGGTSDEKQPIPEIGWFTHCKDTEGNDFSLFESDNSAAG
jgi:predicted enzyme related to lactoylglutathione lyase